MSTEKEFQEHIDEYNHEVFHADSEQSRELNMLFTFNHLVLAETKSHKDFSDLLYLTLPVVILLGFYGLLARFL